LTRGNSLVLRRGLHAYDVSLRSIWFQWTTVAVATGQSPQLADWIVGSGADSLIVNVNIRDDVRDFPQTLQVQLWSYVSQCTTLVADLPNANYFETQVYPSPHTQRTDGLRRSGACCSIQAGTLREQVRPHRDTGLAQ
jgi:hypothetical protein